MILLGVPTLINGFLVMILIPETKHSDLPQNMSEANDLKTRKSLKLMNTQG